MDRWTSAQIVTIGAAPRDPRLQTTVQSLRNKVHNSHWPAGHCLLGCRRKLTCTLAALGRHAVHMPICSSKHPANMGWFVSR